MFRHAKILAAGAIVLLASLASGEVLATHFRGAHITWSRVSGTTVDFTVRHAWRVFPESIRLGDGNFAPPGALVATPVDLNGETYEVYEANFRHTYPHNGPFDVGFNSCCRISTLSNSADSSFRVITRVDLNTSNQGSTVSSLPVILQMAQGPNSVQLPASDPDGTDITCRMATSSESFINSVASVGGQTLSVSPACVLTWDASAAADRSKWAAQVILDQGGLPTAMDFIIEINAGLVNNDPPSCTLNGPSSSTVSVGQLFSISMTGTDPDGDNLTVGHLGLPAGATLTPPSGTTASSPVTATFDWTPASAQTRGVTVTFTDPFNQAGQCSFTVNVIANDRDGDGVPDDQDNCPDVANSDQLDSDGDGIGDACDPCPVDPTNDVDDDGFCADVDNCPLNANSDQADTDTDGQGDACDLDDDGDGVDDTADNCPLVPNSDQADLDNDGQGDACDADVDGDGVNDAEDQCLNTAPGDVTDAAGCSVAQICPCENEWKNHGAYVSCVAHASEDFLDLGLITEAEKDAIVSEAGQSQCGHKK